MAAHLACILSRYLGREFTRSRPWSESVEQRPPIRAKTIATTLRTATARGNLQRSRRDTTGASKKLIRIARTSGSKNSFAQTKAERMTTRYATSISFPSSTGFSDARLFGKAREKSSKFAPAPVYVLAGQSQQKSKQKGEAITSKKQFLRCYSF